MDSAGHHQHPRDRRHDERPVIDGWAKPAVLRRSTVRAICGVWLALVVYGTLGPFGFADGKWLAPAETWHWIPPAQSISLSSYNDIFTNLLVYIPVGVALALFVRRRRGVWARELVLAMLLATALSYLTELLQQFMPARSSSRVDLLVNSSAALFGCLIAPGVQNTIRRCHELAFWHWRTHPWLVLSWLMAGLTAVLMTVPWDLTWPAIDARWHRPLDLLDFRRFAVFALLGFSTAMAMIERLGRQGRAVGEALRRVFLLGVLLEGCQIFIASHTCGLLDIGTIFLGGLVGCRAARRLGGLGWAAEDAPSGQRRVLAFGALLGLIAFALLAGVSRIDATGLNPYEPRVVWLPFRVHFFQPFDRVVTDVAEALVLYASVTALCLYLSPGRGRHPALLLLVGLVGLVQMAQMSFLHGAADVTPLLLAVVAWLVTVRCWDAFLPQPPSALHAARAQTSPAVP